MSIVLRSSDNETFEIEEKVAKQSQTLKHMIDDNCADAEIPLPNLTAKTLAPVIEYCTRIVEGPEAADLKAFEADFLTVHQNILADLILAANYLNIKSLLDVTYQALEAKIRQENAWAFD